MSSRQDERASPLDDDDEWWERIERLDAALRTNPRVYLDRIPGPDATPEQMYEFALSFEAYMYWEPREGLDALYALYHRAAQAFEERQVLPSSLVELRSVLFGEQRRIKWGENSFDEEPITPLMRALVDKIRSGDWELED
jgi:hypothetical protein